MGNVTDGAEECWRRCANRAPGQVLSRYCRCGFRNRLEQAGIDQHAILSSGDPRLATEAGPAKLIQRLDPFIRAFAAPLQAEAQQPSAAMSAFPHRINLDREIRKR